MNEELEGKETDFSYYENLISVENKEKFECFKALLYEYNEKYNLTSILDERDVFYKHFLDSVFGEKYLRKSAKVAEVGSGAGFPSVPLKIIRDDLSFDLFESVGKKCEFLNVVKEKLCFENFNVFNMRSEDAGKNPLFREKYDHCVARAVANMNTLSEYCIPLVKKGGTFVAYKSADTSEIFSAKGAYLKLGGKIATVEEYSLPNGYGGRSLAVIEKTERTPPKYPRGQGKERKNPLQ